MIKIAICDDEDIFISKISENVKFNFSKLNANVEIDTFKDGISLLASHEDNLYDVIFLDIDMPNFSGMETAQKLYDINRYQIVVFITSHDELVYEALKLQPLNFIRKRALEKDLPSVIKNIIEKTNKDKKEYAFKFNGNIYKVKLKNILYISSCRHIITVYCVNGNTLNVTDTIKHLSNELQSLNFVKVNSGCLVNLNYILSFQSDCVLLDDNSLIPVSRYLMKKVKETFKVFMR